MQEKRKHKRYSAKNKVIYATAEKPHKKQRTTSVDISLDGASIKIKGIIKGAGKIILQIYNPALRDYMKATGDLAWQSGFAEPGSERAGIRFTEIPYTELKALLAETLNEALQQKLSQS